MINGRHRDELVNAAYALGSD